MGAVRAREEVTEEVPSRPYDSWTSIGPYVKRSMDSIVLSTFACWSFLFTLLQGLRRRRVTPPFRRPYDKTEAGEALCPLKPSGPETHLLRLDLGVFPWQSPTRVLTPRG